MPRMATAAKARGPYTSADLEKSPDDGKRYELIDGHVTPVLVVETDVPFPVRVVPAELVR
jgi:hypothetical protein